MLSQEIQLLQEFCAAEMAVGMTVEDVAEQGSLPIFFSSHRGHAHMAVSGNVISYNRILRPSICLVHVPLSRASSHRHDHPIALSTTTMMDMSALPPR